MNIMYGVSVGSADVRARESHEDKPGPVSFWEAVKFWWLLGCISFGGPAGQIAIMHTELVERRRWISERRFMHALNFCMVLPGPEAQQLATYIGWLLHGTKGGIAAGGLFVAPSLVLLMVLSAVYVTIGAQPVIAAALGGVKAAVVAIVIHALVRIGGRAIKNGVLLLFAIGSFLAMAVGGVPFPWIVLTAALLGLLGARISPATFVASSHGGHKSKNASGAAATAVIDDHDPTPPHAALRIWRLVFIAAWGLLMWGLPVYALTVWQGAEGLFTHMAKFFTTAALVTFGGAYAVLPYVAKQAVEKFRWLEASQMIDGLALGETTPGPLIMVVCFVGFLAGYQVGDASWQGAILGCLIAAYFTFLPSFLFIFLGGPFIERLRGDVNVSSALTGITAAVVGAILFLAVYFAREVFLPGLSGNLVGNTWSLESFSSVLRAGFRGADFVAMTLAAMAFYALYVRKTSTHWVVAACGAAGLLRYLLS